MAREAPNLRGWLESFVFESGFFARYPYYAYVLAQLEPVLDPSVALVGGPGAVPFFHVSPPSSLRNAPAAEMAMTMRLGRVGSSRMV